MGLGLGLVQGWRACVHTPSRVVPSAGRHQLPCGSSTYFLTVYVCDISTQVDGSGQVSREEFEEGWTFVVEELTQLVLEELGVSRVQVWDPHSPTEPHLREAPNPNPNPNPDLTFS